MHNICNVGSEISLDSKRKGFSQYWPGSCDLIAAAHWSRQTHMGREAAIWPPQPNLMMRSSGRRSPFPAHIPTLPLIASL